MLPMMKLQRLSTYHRLQCIYRIRQCHQFKFLHILKFLVIHAANIQTFSQSCTLLTLLFKNSYPKTYQNHLNSPLPYYIYPLKLARGQCCAPTPCLYSSHPYNSCSINGNSHCNATLPRGERHTLYLQVRELTGFASPHSDPHQISHSFLNLTTSSSSTFVQATTASYSTSGPRIRSVSARNSSSCSFSSIFITNSLYVGRCDAVKPKYRS